MKFLFVILSLSFVTQTFAQWKVFDRYDLSKINTSSNKLQNANFEISGSSLQNWSRFEDGYSASSVAQSGTQSLMCVSSLETDQHGASQTVYLNQTIAKPVLISGWSKAQNVSGNPDDGFSFYVDVTYTNGEHLWGQTLNFSTGTHDWQYLEKIIFPTYPIDHLSCYCLFRWSHTGTVWFDNFNVVEVESQIATFDGESVILNFPPSTSYDSASGLELKTDDDLILSVASNGCAIVGLTSAGVDVFSKTSTFASGWFVCDRAISSAWYNFSGTAEKNNSLILQHGSITSLNLSAEISYLQTGNFIKCTVVISNLISDDRAVSVYFALPTDFSGGDFWVYQNEKSPVNNQIESAELRNYQIGARGFLSESPLAVITKDAGLSLAIPPDKYRPYRFIYNKDTKQFFAVFDVCLSKITEKFPNTAELELLLFNCDKNWGFRSALNKYYQFYPKAFERKYTNEGVWVAFADLRPITNIFDFHINYHETSSSTQWKSDDNKNINSYRYLIEPWSYWMDMPTNLDNTSYTDVTNCLYDLHENGSAYEKAKAETVLSSGVRNKDEDFLFKPAAEPWCTYGAVFNLSASPFIYDKTYPITKFSNEWNATEKNVYNLPETYGYLDGEYIDSFAARANVPNYYSNYLRVTSFPLTFLEEDFTPMSPMIYGTYEAVAAIKTDLDVIDKPFIANAMYSSYYLPVGIGIFDFCGIEISMLDGSGNLDYPSDRYFSHFRALSGRKPYGFLMNDNFNYLSHDEMEKYMKLCAGYGFYPSAFSHNASSDNYFETPSLYERDRNLFKKYIPIIIEMNNSGWQPITGLTSDFSGVVFEKFGTKNITDNLFFSTRNLTDSNVTFNITFFSEFWGKEQVNISNLFDGSTTEFYTLENYYNQSFSLSPNETKIYSVETTVPEPTILFFAIICSLIFKGGYGKIMN